MSRPLSRRWLAPEVIQTSAMDCGPAALKCLLDGFGLPTSYGRLREACQTSVDGTSIDEIEAVARQLGLDAEQVMLPVDFLWMPEARALPAMVVVRLPHGPTHFVILWRRHGRWLQVMDPGVGRRWVTTAALARELLVHSIPVPASDWLDWAGSDDTVAVYAGSLRSLGASSEQAAGLIAGARGRQTWQAMAGLDAAARMVQTLVDAGGLKPGTGAISLLESLLAATLKEPPGSCAAIPPIYWSVAPLKSDGDESRLVLRGAVLLRVVGRLATGADAGSEPETGLSTELSAALNEKPVRPAREMWSLIRADGILTPLALIGVIGLAMGGLMIEALLFRGLFELARDLNLASQRIAGFSALLCFVFMMWALELPIVGKSLRLGRHLETRLRLMLMEKLPRLNDRYFQSRPVSDMAERSHSLYLLRYLPELALNFARAGWELLFTLAGIAWIAPASTPLALGIALLALAISVIAQPMMSERDLKVRSHFGAMQGSYLDALLGGVPIRTHSAERSVRRGHEALLVQWARAARHPLGLSLWVDGIRSLGCLGLAGTLLYAHIQAVGISGDLLLLAFWVLKLPTLGERLATLSLQYPVQRNIALRLLEPIQSPEESRDEAAGPEAPPAPPASAAAGGVAIEIHGAGVVAAGHWILREVDLSVQPGEHIAIVGPSGAGKSSLLGLLLGWHQAVGGSVRVDGEPLTVARQVRLRQETAWVDPAIQIWNRSLLENLRYSPSAGPHGELARILEQADLARVLARLPEGLQSGLGEGGARLSGGEGQRVRLARALWQKEIRLVLLDEPFRGLDRHQRRRHLAQCREIWERATLVCVTHDIEETRGFDRVLVVENGAIVEDGHPDALMADSDSRFRSLLDSETRLQAELWGSPVWRKLKFAHGQVGETA